MSNKIDRQDYTLFLPVYQQGDDLAMHLRTNKGSPAKAFLDQAQVYEEAARLCKRVAGVVHEAKNKVDVFGDTHYISINGAVEDFEGMVRDNHLIVESYGPLAEDVDFNADDAYIDTDDEPTLPGV